MAELISAAGVIFDYGLEGIVDVGNAVVSTPILLGSCIMGIAFLGVSLFKRLLSVNM